MLIPTISANIDTIHTGIIIFVGLLDPNIVLSDIIVVGNICIEAVFNSIKVVIVSFGVSFLFIFCILLIASIEYAVAAFPIPKASDAMFSETSSSISSVISSFLNKGWVIFLTNLDIPCLQV